jgi:hypothetical protein
MANSNHLASIKNLQPIELLLFRVEASDSAETSRPVAALQQDMQDVLQLSHVVGCLFQVFSKHTQLAWLAAALPATGRLVLQERLATLK